MASRHAGATLSRDRKWLKWLIDTIGPLKRPPAGEVVIISREPPRSLIRPQVWPFRSDRVVETFRDPLGDFARHYAPEIVRHAAWRPSLQTTRGVLARLWATLEWGRTNGWNRGLHCRGRAELWIRMDRSGRQEIVVGYDDMFTLLHAFTVLTGRYIYLFRLCSSPDCEKVFVAARRPARGRAPFCSKRCGVRHRQQNRRQRIRRQGT